MKYLRRIGWPCIIVLLMLFSAYPYIFYCFVNLPSEDVMIFLFLGVFLIYSIKSGITSKKGVPYIGGLMLTQAIVWLFFCILHNDTSYLVRVLLIIESYLAIFILFTKGRTYRFANIYNWTLVIQGVCGVVAFFLFFAGLISPVAEYYFNTTRYEKCFILTCSNTVAGNFMRVGGYFDEPGALAFWGVFALVINKLTYDSRKVEYILLGTLLFTFSAAYFVIVPIYLICFNYHKIKRFILVVFLSVPLLFVVYNSISDNEFVALYTTERFEGGTIRSSRFEQGEIAKKLFIQSPILGNGAKEILNNNGMAEENPYEILAKDGIIGYLFTYLPLFFLVINYRKDKYAMYSILILFVDYLQRPFHVNQMQFFMLYLFCLIVILRNEKKQLYKTQLYGI